MRDNQTYFQTNKALWNKKTDFHIQSDFYNMETFMKGESSLRKIELEELPDLKDKSLLHLQCHFGQDTLSLERMGAHCTGVDLSDNGIANAIQIKDKLNLKSKFICCNVYETDKHVEEIFDVVYTSYGTICWLPNLDLWADQISKRLKKGGLFFMTEFHPVLNMFEWDKNVIEYNYFNSGKPYEEVEEGTYADTSADISMKEFFWLHPLSDLFSALINNGLEIRFFKEYDYSPYNIFGQMEERGDQEFVFKHNGIVIPHVYTIKAYKRSHLKTNC